MNVRIVPPQQINFIMQLLTRTEFGNPILREKAREVKLGFLATSEFKKLIQNMFFTMHKTGGVGLAAPQIGKALQLAVIEIQKTKMRPQVKSLPPTVIINPKIIKHSKQAINDWEGCLSFTDVRGLVPRYKEITVSYYNEHGKKKIINFEGFQARVFQHEIDHLNGFVYVDRMKEMKTLITLGEFKKRILKKKGLKSR